MLKQRAFSTSVLLLIILVGAIGCQKSKQKPEGLPDLIPCKLTFTCDGQPVDGAVVMLNGTEQWKPTGVTDAQGTVAPATYGEYQGVPAGKYVVTIIKSKPVDPSEDPMGIVSTGEVDTAGVVATDVVPNKKYAGTNTSDLEIEVVAGTPFEQTFPVE